MLHFGECGKTFYGMLQQIVENFSKCFLHFFNDDMWMDSMTSHDRAEIVHIRLVFFQIRVENLKIGPPIFSIFCLFWDHQVWGPITVHDSESEGSTWLCLSCFDLWPRHKIIYNWKPGGPLFPISTLIWKNTSLIWSTSARLCDVRRSPPAYHHLVVYSLYFK